MQLTLRLLFPLLFIGCSLTATAQPRDSVEGVHYVALAKAVPTETEADKIETRELFWYGCHECMTLEPILSEWRDNLAGDLVFVRTPAVFNDLMALHARIYYTGIALKMGDRINEAAFRALQEQENPLRTEAQIKDFFVKNKVSAEAFTAAWNSDAVIKSVQQARERTVAYGITRLPSVIVNGRYQITLNAKVFSQSEMNIAINNVIRKLRKERRSNL